MTQKGAYPLRPKDIRVIKTRKTLRQAFLRLSQSSDFDQITIESLCQEAMVRRTTFYRHFHDKYDFLGHVLQSLLDQIQSDLLPSYNALPAADYYYQLSVHILEMIQDHSHFFYSLFHSRYHDLVNQEVIQRIQIIINREIPQRHQVNSANSHRDIPFLTRFFASGLLALIQDWVLKNFPTSKEQFARQINQVSLTFWQNYLDK